MAGRHSPSQSESPALVAGRLAVPDGASQPAEPAEARPSYAAVEVRDGLADRVLRLLRNRGWVILALVLLGGACGVALALAQNEEYRASATLLLHPPAASSGGLGVRAADLDRAAATDGELISLPVVAARAAREGGTGLSPAEVADRVSVDLSDNADVVRIDATDGSRDLAARVANDYAKAYIGFRRETNGEEIDRAIAAIERELDGLTEGDRAQASDLRERRAELRVARAQLGDPTLVQPAAPPAEASGRHLGRYLAIGLLAGLLLGIVLALMLERLDRRIKSIDELESIYELPVLARIPRSQYLKRKRGSREETLNRKLRFSEEAEAFRTLRTNLRYFNVDKRTRSVLVVSPLPGDGKSTIARYLAITMASMGDSVVLVHADLRKPEGAQGSEEGLSLVLAGFDLDEALTEVPVAFDSVSEESRILVELPTGPAPPNPTELMESARMRAVIRELEERFDYVIVDSPALGRVSDALTLVPAVSGVLVVSGVDRTTRHAAMDLRKQIARLGGRPLGVVANFGTPVKGDYYYYGNERKKQKQRASAR